MRVPTPAAVILARAGNDETLDPVRRMTALAQLGALAEAGEVFVEVPDDIIAAARFSNPPEDKPKEEYVWVRGARVKKK